ncbi:MAG: hypothetical protein KAG98_06300 [Lentisphaeria bacterium]|nr:hypothetical protein [Lentisphaeria bacterium]
MNESEKSMLRKLENEVYMAELEYDSYRDAENIILSRLSREMTATAGEEEYYFILEEKNKTITVAKKVLAEFKATL